MIYKFVKHEISPIEVYKNVPAYKIHKKLENEEELTREEKTWLMFPQTSPVHKLMGWAYDFREFLSEFWVETEYYGIIKMWAWDKTSIRKSESNKGLKIIKIVEVE